jgi:hypothetical protein
LDEGVLVGAGQVGATALGAKGFLDGADQFAHFDVLGGHLVDHDDDRFVRLTGQLEHLTRVRFDAGGGADDEDRGLCGGNGSDSRTGEIGVAGRVDDVDELSGCSTWTMAERMD